MEPKTRTVTLTPEREALYKAAREKAKQMLNICDAILESHVTEARACKNEGVPLIVFRNFCRTKLTKEAAGCDILRIKKDDWSDWREELIYSITEMELPAPDDFNEVFDDICKNVLTEKQALILQMNMRDGLSYEEIGNELDVGRERVRQIRQKALRILRKPDYRNRLAYGAEYAQLLREKGTEQAKYDMRWLKAQEVTKAEQKTKIDTLRHEINDLQAANKTNEAILSSASSLEALMKMTSLEDLDFSCRTYNSLRRYFGREATAWDVAQLSRSDEELMRVRNLGRKSCNEIISRITDLFGADFFK